MHPGAPISSPGLTPPSDVSDAQEWPEPDRLQQLRMRLLHDSNDVRTLLEIGDLHIRLGEHDRALSCYERVAEIYSAAGKLVKAVAVFKQMHWLIERHASHLAPRYRYTEARLAEVFERLGLHDDALSCWRNIAKRYLAAGREQDAMPVLAHIIELAPHNLGARGMLATLQAHAGHTETALRSLEQLVTIALSHGQRDDAIRALQNALKLKDSVDHARLLAELLLERGSRDDAFEALANLSICYRANPKSLPTLRLLVRAFDSVDQPDKANEVLKESARVVFASGARDTFNRIVNALLERAPHDPEVAALDAMHEPVLLQSTVSSLPDRAH